MEGVPVSSRASGQLHALTLLMVGASGCAGQPGSLELGPSPLHPTRKMGWPKRIVVAPSGEAYAIGNAALFHSANQGESWSQISPARPPWLDVHALALDSATGTIYLGARIHQSQGEDVPGKSTGGLYASRDGGRAWTAKGPGFPDLVSTILIDSGDPKRIYVGTEGAGLFRSTDEGQSWSPSQQGIPEKACFVSAVVFDQRTTTLYAATNMGLFRSADRGDTWNQIKMHLRVRDYDTKREHEREPSIGAVVVHPRGPEILFVSTEDGLYRTMDGGSTWEHSGDLGMGPVVPDPKAPDTLYIPTATGLQRSTDLGKSWAPVGEALASTRLYSVAIHPGPPWLLYAGSDKGVYRLRRDGTEATEKQ